MNEITAHPDYKVTFDRWLSVCRAAGRTEAEARQKAHSYAYSFVSRRIERAKFYQGKRAVGPDPLPDRSTFSLGVDVSSKLSPPDDVDSALATADRSNQ